MAEFRHSERIVFNSEFTKVQKFYTFISPHERTSTERLPAGSYFYARTAQGWILQTTHLKSHRTEFLVEWAQERHKNIVNRLLH
jgi:hypothetical protein